VFDWTVEGWLSIYLVLAVVLIALLATWGLTRPSRWADWAKFGMYGVLALLVFYAVIDVVVETKTEAAARQLREDRKQLERKTEEMADGLRDQDLDKVFNHVSRDFRYRSMDKDAMRKAGNGAVRQYGLKDVKVWDIEIVEVDRPNRRAVVHFNVKGKTNATGKEYLLCKSKWVLDSDGEWRMVTFELYNPVVDTNNPLDLGIR